MKLKVNLYKWIIIFISLYSTGTITYSLINNYFPLNRIFGVTILILTVFLIIREKQKPAIKLLLISLMMIFLSIMQTNKMIQNINDALYWLNSVLLLYLFSIPQKSWEFYYAMEQVKNFIKVIVYFNTLIVVICLLNKDCYNTNWGGHYFVGYAPSNHVMASGSCLLLVLTMYIVKDLKSELIKILVMLPTTYALLETGARVYIISVAIIWFVLYFYCLRNINIKICLIPIVLVGSYYVFMNSGMLKKLLTPNAYGGLTGVDLFTAGRSTFWIIDLNAYIHSGIGILLGKGFDFPYLVNEKIYGNYIWAHNDVIDILMSIGLIGFFIYFSILIKNFKYVINKNGKFIGLALTIYFLFVALINGLFAYQHYLFSYIIMICYITNSKKYERSKKNYV